ncbi:SYS1-related integral membrane protein [Purpureocillium lilacinum]|uniref:SYS1-related integral membrane protein n=1 Tax=Purpureocillium lilacinum TaxID=33203 RepID=A0A179G2F7_PURLI|nr:SYS1-related integral membrane protein [Purpureocillium lilacinum]OAQ71648.1 SYS1-related integral membrane protein [Purpureocillium lilacinum]OAQ92717.1 SYS1-related integral membrane protein [Purpureocillium lilacinum]GJN71226.1 hypothetical protein PLICBS_005288 [Purpureocillium lilacinum]GJN82897.1 hypothetical protein PLIIFM63780_006443 [Purpureocillium lilacinum]
MPRRRRPPRAGALSELQPLRIASQIALLQVLYYVAAVVFLLFTALVAGLPFGLNMLLGWDAVRGDTTTGWLLAFVWLLDGGLCMAVAIVVLIARSKLVPDFALTIHFLHLLATTLYTRSLPRHAMWWATMLASSALAVAAGTWGCRYRELQPVFFGGGRILGSGGGAAPPASGTADDDDDDGDVDVEAGEGGDGTPEDADAGFTRGRGRGRGRDGAGEYEMVQMQKAA